jgi:hypothetical protein
MRTVASDKTYEIEKRYIYCVLQSGMIPPSSRRDSAGMV